MSYSSTNSQRLYVQKESTYGTIPNGTGSATVANADACRFMSLNMNADSGEIERSDKTGTWDKTVGQVGKKGGTFEVSMTMAPNGAAGSKPDMDEFLESLFGKAATVVTSTSVTYSPDDASPSLAIWDFNTPAAVSQRVAFGAVVNSARFNIGGAEPTVDFSGPCRWVLDSDQMADVTTESAAKGGLTSMPTEPSAPVTNGIAPPGFLGSITIDGTAYSTFRAATINMSVDRELPGDVFNSYYAGEPMAGTRRVTIDFSIYDEDSSANAALRTLKQKAMKKTAVDIVLVVGTVAGSIWTFTLNDVQLPAPKYDYSGKRRVVAFSGCLAHASSISAKDPITLAIT